MGKTALIIGGAGFVGNYLAKYLHDSCGYFVYSTKMPQEVFESEYSSVIDLDLLDIAQIQTILEKTNPDYIFHLAAQSSVAVSWKKPQLTVDVNIKGSVNLFEALRFKEYAGNILVVGSGEEYGLTEICEQPIKENVLPRPGNIYAATKVCQSLLGQIYARAYGLNIIMVRAFNHIGPNQLPQFVVADFCSQVAAIERGEQKPRIFVGNLSAKRDFLDVRDVVAAYSELIVKGKRGEIYNVGSGQAVAIRDILEQILQLSDVKIEVVTDKDKFRPVDVPLIVADISKLKADTGWKQKVELNSTLRETLEYWRQSGGA